MDREWTDGKPIYRQIRDRMAAMILDEVFEEGDALPSVRAVAEEYRVNPLTVLKGLQELVEEGAVEARRGIGMFVLPGARALLMEEERRKFLEEEWPRLRRRIERLGLAADELLRDAPPEAPPDAGSASPEEKS